MVKEQDDLLCEDALKECEDTNRPYMNCCRTEQVINAEKQREKMSALGQLAGGIAHDFNNQLMSIIGNATMIQKTENIAKIREYADRIIHISQSSANLTKKILMFSKTDSSANELINLKNIIDNTASMVESILDKRIEVIYTYSASNKFIMGNEGQIENLMFNLIINSRDAILTTGIIEISADDVVIEAQTNLSHGEIINKGKYIRISISDNGKGMSRETLNRIFEPYFSTKNKSKGTGLGLSVVFGTVKSHSGFINVETKQNKGTMMQIYLPVAADKDNFEKMISDGMIDDNQSNVMMLVDDDINVLDIEAELFEDLGYEVEKFNNPINALEYYKNNGENVSCVVLDMMMPEMSGKELYQSLKILNSKLKPVFISGYTNQCEQEELIRDGALFIEKPFTFEELSEKMAKLY